MIDMEETAVKQNYNLECESLQEVTEALRELAEHESDIVSATITIINLGGLAPWYVTAIWEEYIVDPLDAVVEKPFVITCPSK